MRPALALLPLVLLACPAPEEAPVGPPPPPTTQNTLIVFVDTLRPDHLGAYGYDRPTSPTVDSLAAEGARFETTYAPTPWTYSSSASLMTGLYPAAHGAIIPGKVRNEATSKGSVVQLHERFVTLSEVAEAAGVKTALIARNRYLGFGIEQGFGHYENEKGRTAKAQTDRALEWLDSVDEDDRFLLVVHYMDVHTPNKSRPENRAHFPPADTMSKEERVYAQKWKRKYAKPHPEKIEGFDTYRAQRTALYDASVRYTDHQVGRLVEGLGERRRDTLIVFTADHGEEFWEHAALEKQLWKDPRNLVGVGHGHTFFDETVRIPLVISQPGVVETAVIHGRASLLDVLPTVTEMMGIPDEHPREGLSLAPALRGEPLDAERTLIFDAVAFGNDKQGLLTGSAKYTRSWEEPALLVDLATDPGEQSNLAEARPEEAAALEGQLELLVSASEALGESIRAGEEVEVHEFSPEELEALEALGYVWGEREDEPVPTAGGEPKDDATEPDEAD